AASVAMKVSVCVPFAVVVVSHVGDAVLPLTLWLYSVVPLSSFSTNCVGAWALLTARLTPLLVPLTVIPLAGLVIDAVMPGGGGEPPHVAPDATTGVVASLLIVTAAEIAQVPALSVATACTWYAPGASEPVTHHTSAAHVVALHDTVPNTAPLPHSLRLVSATPLEAVALTSMLPPVHSPLAGYVI